MRHAALVFLALLMVFAVTSCKLWDTLFLNAESVDVEDLASYSGTLPASRIGCIETMATGAMGALFETVGETIGAPTVSGSNMAILSLVPSMRKVEPLLNKVLSSATGKSVTFTMTDFTGDSLDAEVHLLVENESGTGPYGGTVTIELLQADLDGSKSAASPPLTGTADFDGEAKITAAHLTDGAGNYINTGILNAKTHGDLDVQIGSDGMPTSLEFYLAIDINVGLSVTNADGTGGKFIITFKFVDSAKLAQADFEDPESIASDFELKVTIKVYDNSNDLVETYEITQDDIMDMASGM